MKENMIKIQSHWDSSYDALFHDAAQRGHKGSSLATADWRA